MNLNVFIGSEAAQASRDEVTGMGTVLSQNGGGFTLFLFSFWIPVPMTDFATYGKNHGIGCLTAWAAGAMGLISIKKGKK